MPGRGEGRAMGERFELPVVAIVLACLLGLLSRAGAKDAARGLYDLIQGGRNVHSEKCSPCHDFRTPSGGLLSRGQWEALVGRMEDKGASLNGEEREAVLAYLAVVCPPRR